MDCECSFKFISCPMVPVTDDTMKRCEVFISKMAEMKFYKILALSWIDATIPTGEILLDDDRKKYPDCLTDGKLNAIWTFPLKGANDKHFMFISSNPGTGKSQILQWSFLERLKAGVGAWYTTAQALKDELYKLATGQIKCSEVVDGIRVSRYVVIEDVGMEKQTDGIYFEEFLKTLLDCTGKKIIFSSNHSLRHLQDIYARVPQLVSRLDYVWGACGSIIWWQGQDRRGK